VVHRLVSESEIDSSHRLPEKTILLQSASNRGYAAGNNLGIRVALARGADYVLILNSDTLVDRGFLEPLVQYAETHGRVGAVSPKVLDTNGHASAYCTRRRPVLGWYFFCLGLGRIPFPNNRWIRKHYYRGEYSFDHPKEVDILPGCCMLIRRSVFEQIGLLDESTFLFLEEFILHEKLRTVGMTSAVVPASWIVHKHGESIKTMPSGFARNAERASLRYYLAHYRHHTRFAVAALMFVSRNPQDYLKGWRQ
jgi:GT2 family glycosyltransferase